VVKGKAYLGVGSNLHPYKNLQALLERLAGDPYTVIIGISTIYRTPALPRSDAPPGGDPDFLNGVVEVETILGPEEMVAFLYRTEEALGRVRGEDRYAPRPMDVDLLHYLSPLGSPGRLHPDVLTRPWVAHSLLELAPELIIPPDGPRLQEIATAFGDPGGNPEMEFTDSLRRQYLGS
jgi:2-amino-4-hydroxy-6-hydroxymethyldihydropteridine diphosphokinase